jgi:hypothetical protein
VGGVPLGCPARTAVRSAAPLGPTAYSEVDDRPEECVTE